MAKADLHVHSSYSARPSEWFLQRLGTRESYTDPETIYREALKQGMDFVTITDHNTIEGALILKERHPERVFTGVEATTYFPETGCKVHLLVYGFNEAQFAMIRPAAARYLPAERLCARAGPCAFGRSRNLFNKQPPYL